MLDEADDAAVAAPRTPGLVRVLGAVIVVALLVVAATAGWLLRGSGGRSVPGATSIDAGFARDMSTHHIQAVTMAGYERDNTTEHRCSIPGVRHRDRPGVPGR